MDTGTNYNLVPRLPSQTLSRSRGEKSTFLHSCEIKSWREAPRLRDKVWEGGLGTRLDLDTCTSLGRHTSK